MLGAKIKYREESHPELLVKIMTKGHGRAEFCKKIQISLSTFCRWLDNFEEFRLAYELGRTYSLAWWENQAMANLSNPKFNGFMWSRMVFNKFPDKYTEKGRQIQIQRLQKLFKKDENPSFDAQAREIVKEWADGNLTVEEADKATGVVKASADIKKVSELEQMMDEISEVMRKEGKL